MKTPRAKMKRRLNILLVLGLSLLVGCTTQRPLVVKQRAQAVRANPPGGKLMADADRGLNPGDQIRVTLPLNSELNATATVQPDGTVDLPGIGTLRVAGLTVAEVRRKLKIKYARIVRKPKLSVDVTRVEEPVVYVGGEVTRPGTVRYVNGMTVAAALFQAGGPTPAAQLHNVILLRESKSGNAAVLSLDLEALLQGKSNYVNPALRPYDVLIVPASKIAKVNQFVDHYVDGLLPLATITGFAWIYRIVVRGY